MTKILHITNGDNFTRILKKRFPEETIITWREMLCEGRTVTNVGSELFWKVRFDYLKERYKTSKNTFIEGMLREYKNLCNQKTQDEVVLWFDHDLYSQINMIAILSWLKNQKRNIQISLVSNGEEGKRTLLADMPEEEMQQHYKNRTHLTLDDVEYADYIWQLYCSNNPLRLETFAKFNSSQFQHVPEAIKAHILRFPTVKNGLNKIENDILLAVSENTYGSKEELVQQLVKTEKTYGYTDLQYGKILENLRSFFHSLNPVQLSAAGKELMGNMTHYYAFMKNDDTYLGGSKKYSFLYHSASDKLLKL